MIELVEFALGAMVAAVMLCMAVLTVGGTIALLVLGFAMGREAWRDIRRGFL